MIIRLAERKDISEMRNIYNEAVVNSIATFDLEEKSMEDRILWFEEHIDLHPLIVAEIDAKVVGYASLSSYRTKEAYRTTAEVSIYVQEAFQKSGIGKALLEEILKMAREAKELHTIISVITAGNTASAYLHEKYGFTYCGRIKEVGKKFGQMLDIDNYQLRI